MRVPRSTVALAVAGVALGLTACTASKAATPAAPSVADPASRTISANALGKATGTPDLLTITIGVQTQASRAAAALADNNSRATAVIANLKAGGVADKDVQTSQLAISPTYGGGPNPTITGYQVSDLVTAKLRNLSGAGTLIDDAASAAGDAARVDGISFSIADDSALLASARADAVRQAVARVKTMADAAGVTLGDIRSITDQSAQQPVLSNQFAAGSASSEGAAPVPIQPGTEDLTVDVTVVYDIV
jgi:uncharacterized protein YggE